MHLLGICLETPVMIFISTRQVLLPATPPPDAKEDTIAQIIGDFIHNFGEPEHLTFDGAQVQVVRKTKFQDLINQHNNDSHRSAPRRPHENPAENKIQ